MLCKLSSSQDFVVGLVFDSDQVLLPADQGFFKNICREHIAEDSQDDSQSKYKVSKTYNVVSVVFCSDQWRFIKCIT